jgi:hypothetical protein
VAPGTTLHARARAVGKNTLASDWSPEAAGTSMTIGADALGAHGAAITRLQQQQSGLVRDHKNLLLAQGDAHAAVQVFAENFLNEFGRLIARYGVKLDLNGWITGFEQSNGGPGADYFDILASSFRIRHPSAPAAVPFYIEDGKAYMDSAFIKKLLATQIEAESLSAITANIGLLRTAATGARLEIASTSLKVFDQNNTLRVELGIFDQQ